jgi:type VI secretion system secreted protein VgrG
MPIQDSSAFADAADIKQQKEHWPLRWSTTAPVEDSLRHYLVVAGFRGHEAISQPFEFHVDLLLQHTEPGLTPLDIKLGVSPFKLLGQNVTIHLTQLNDQPRYFNGICKSVSEGLRDEHFIAYQMTVVPELWLLSKRAQSRIFQQMTVPEILKEVFDGLDVSLSAQGTYPRLDYCVQYRETDLNFASRLMEEEGIFYYFTHGEKGHTLVVADEKGAFRPMPGQDSIIYATSEQGLHGEHRISSWEKSQELRSGKCTLRDHNFQVPDSDLEAGKDVGGSVKVGKVPHSLRVGHNDHLELYDYPGGYAKRFDGVTPGGGDDPDAVQGVFEDNHRTVGIRMEQETLPGLTIHGAGTCRNFISGHVFTLNRHHDGDGPYLITGVRHSVRYGPHYRSTSITPSENIYENAFTCTPLDLPFRPARVTPKPTVHGTQTAVVVGPAGDEIFTDRYGRVKVQFFWDREGKKDGMTSCWVRVGTPWAGKQWGMVHIPRVGQEVIVDFLEGDPDCPIIVGSVYNADMMPPYELPKNKTQSGVKSRSSLEGNAENYNEIRFEDKKGEELLTIHAEKDQSIEVEKDETHWVGNDRSKTIDHDEKTHVKHDRTETVDNNESITIGGSRTESVQNDETIKVTGARTRTVGKDETVTIDGSQTIHVGGSLRIDAGDEITITTGASSISMKKNGTITIQGVDVTVKAMTDLKLKGMQVTADGQLAAIVKAAMTQINGDAMLQAKGGVTMIG